MKVSFLSDKLQEKLLFLNHAVSNRGQLPILSCFLITAKQGKLTIKATDLEIGITSSITASIEEEGEVAVLAKNFTDLLTNLNNQKTTLTQEGETLLLKSDKVKASFQTMPKEEFPNLYEEKGEEVLTLKKEDVEKYFSRVVFAASTTETTKPALSGILIDEEKEKVLLVATDSYRLSLQKNVFKTTQGLRKPLVVPSRVIKELFLIKEVGDIKVHVSEKNNQVMFFQGETVLVGRLIESEYPEYQKIIPKEFNTKTEINKEELLKAIRIATVFARETANIIKLSIEKTKIIVSANSPSVGEDSVEIEAKTTGESNEIAFNAKYLLDVLSAINEEDVVFEMNGPLNSGVFKLKGDDSFLHLIMPIRVQG
jgi:DNA polymerase III subunit beta